LSKRRWAEQNKAKKRSGQASGKPSSSGDDDDDQGSTLFETPSLDPDFIVGGLPHSQFNHNDLPCLHSNSWSLCEPVYGQERLVRNDGKMSKHMHSYRRAPYPRRRMDPDVRIPLEGTLDFNPIDSFACGPPDYLFPQDATTFPHDATTFSQDAMTLDAPDITMSFSEPDVAKDPAPKLVTPRFRKQFKGKPLLIAPRRSPLVEDFGDEITQSSVSYFKTATPDRSESIQQKTPTPMHLLFDKRRKRSAVGRTDINQTDVSFWDMSPRRCSFFLQEWGPRSAKNEFVLPALSPVFRNRGSPLVEAF